MLCFLYCPALTSIHDSWTDLYANYISTKLEKKEIEKVIPLKALPRQDTVVI